MEALKQKFAEKALSLYQELRSATKANGTLKVDEVTLSQVVGGARGIKMMLWETSQLDPNKGIRFRGYSIPEIKEALPSGPQGEPKPEGLFWLMLTGEIPTPEEVDALTQEWHSRADVPGAVFTVLDSLPTDAHPMTQLTIGVMAMQSDSIFSRRYAEGMPKSDYWDAVYEDSMNLIARLPRVAAYIYRRTFKEGKHIEPDTSLDYSANYAHMLGSDDEDFRSLMRLYLTIHADHEGGNASAHTVHLVGSTLSDPYLAFSAGMNALAGPLHGLANQEVIKWIFEMIDSLGTKTPTEQQIADYVQQTLDEGKVIPGYGHAVLREPDPRFTAQRRFAEQYIHDSDLISTVWKIFDVVPPMLQALGKVKNPWPNVDAHSGALLVHYGFSEFSYYTVLFGVSRALGVLAAGIWSRALGMPLERPKSVTTDWVMNQVKNNSK
ncbi:citrate (Si)-synthase [Neolewinella litorea]|uniref:citrate synthase (unknown stereospecificity) n=1 Tax=Neolewinella litorea TaxID=2562452 RepID=A0A4S4NK66_9BACT|nr:citrate (Si)-synthase [Neolewinella litorea]THH39335.1 citrate (Si)-synthase [Neolewinella litorea]